LPRVNIHELGVAPPKPRWLAYLRFSRRVHIWLEQHSTAKMIIHSHERTQDHHITTFHGPPFAQIRSFPFWKRCSLRSKVNLWLENRELCSPQVQTIVPNSMSIRQQLKLYYPSISKQLSMPIVPGVGNNIMQRQPHAIPAKGGVIGFVGKEWKRKGLIMAIDIMSELVKQRPDVHFIVAGCDPKEIEPLFKHVLFQFTLLGNIDTSDFYQQLDILLHPAKNEPFGMVITEALSAGVPAVISDACGAASEITPQRGSCLDLTSPVETWADELHRWLNKKKFHVQYQYSWRNTSHAYIQLYKELKV
ncbi:MAG: glycosyltransferase family 4 protein, partial [Mariprofundaceae bacterium]|nr:glycosyltransferase family 4 protein [Mariprofundaceae bacterium]